MKQDDSYAGAWVCKYDQPMFDNHQDEPDLTNSFKSAVQSDLVNNKTSAIPKPIPEFCSENYPQAGGVHD